MIECSHRDPPEDRGMSCPDTSGMVIDLMLGYCDDYLNRGECPDGEQPSEENLRRYLASSLNSWDVEAEVEDNIARDEWDDMLDEAAASAWKVHLARCGHEAYSKNNSIARDCRLSRSPSLLGSDQ